jgi:hypothetical protein
MARVKFAGFWWFDSNRWHKLSAVASRRRGPANGPCQKISKVRRATSSYKMAKGVNKFSFSFPRVLIAFKAVGKTAGLSPKTKQNNLCH